MKRLIDRLLSFILPDDYGSALIGDLSEGYAARRRRSGAGRATGWYVLQACLACAHGLADRSAHAVAQAGAVDTPSRVLCAIRDGWRSHRRARLSFTLRIGVLGLALGFAAAVGSLSLTLWDGAAPYPQSDRLVMAFRTVPRLGFTRAPVSLPDFRDWRGAATVFDELGAYTPVRAVYADPSGEPRRGAFVTERMFEGVLRAPPYAGRTFQEADFTAGSSAIVVSFSFWREVCHGGPALAACHPRIGDRERRVIGIMPPGFRFPNRAVDFWLPLVSNASDRGSNFLQVIGRLRTGVSIEAARNELAAVARRIDQAHPEANPSSGVFVEPRDLFVLRHLLAPWRVTTVAVVAFLLAVWAGQWQSVSTRSRQRHAEFRTRHVLGCRVGQMVMQIAAEQAVVIAPASLIAVAVASLTVRAVAAHLPPLGGEATLDGRSVAGAFAAAAGLGLALTALAAWQLSTQNAAFRMQKPTPMPGPRTAWWTTAQCGITTALAIGCLLFVRSTGALEAADLGFQPERVTSLRVSTRHGGIADPDRWKRTIDALLAHIEHLPGVSAAGTTFTLPLSDSRASRMFVREGDPIVAGREHLADTTVIAGAYFDALNIRLLAGRTFGPTDVAGSSPVVIVNEAMAGRFWPGQSPIGQRFKPGEASDTDEWVTIVGVVANTAQHDLRSVPAPAFYQPHSQAGWADAVHVTVRWQPLAPELDEPALRHAVLHVDPSLTVSDVRSLAARVAAEVSPLRAGGRALLVLTLLAGLLALGSAAASVKDYVAMRRHEIGVRRALGAPSGRLGLTVVASTTRPVVGGVLLGVVLAAAAGSTLDPLLAISAYDPVSYGTAVAAVGGSAVVTCVLRAALASRLDLSRILTRDHTLH